MTNEQQRVQSATRRVTESWSLPTEIGIVLGSGLGTFVHQIDIATAIDYADIPHFARSTVAGHPGCLICGRLAGQPVVAMQGRFHLYEGYSAREVTRPIRVMRELGVKQLIVANASGGLNPSYQRSEIMIIDDHINLMFASPLIGPNHDAWGPRFPDMSRPYNRCLMERTESIARRLDVVLHRGVYAGLRGPTYETRAEYRMLRRLGADVVGMSTVPEVIVAVHGGMRVLGLSVVTNVARPDALPITTHAEVVDAVGLAAPVMAAILHEVIAEQPEAHQP